MDENLRGVSHYCPDHMPTKCYTALLRYCRVAVKNAFLAFASEVSLQGEKLYRFTDSFNVIALPISVTKLKLAQHADPI